MFVVRFAETGRAVVHRADCPLTDARYAVAAKLYEARSFSHALAQAEELIADGMLVQLCGWCRPTEM